LIRRKEFAARGSQHPPMETTAPWQTPCEECGLAPLCLPWLYSPRSAAPVRITHKYVRRGDVVFRPGGKFRGLHALAYGAVKTLVGDAEGNRQVVDIHLPGDLFGLDGMADGTHRCEAVALENCKLCFVRMDSAARMTRHLPGVQREFDRRIGRELERQQRVTRELRREGDAQRRIARFLVDLSQRSQRLGLPGDQLRLHLSRDEIGSLLGLALETVSRSLSRLGRSGVIDVNCRYVTIENMDALRLMA
jgi:CRP/FNR family transcriptional regulator